MFELTRKSGRISLIKLIVTGTVLFLWICFSIFILITGTSFFSVESIISYSLVMLILYGVTSIVLEVISKQLQIEISNKYDNEIVENEQRSEVIKSLFEDYDSLYYLDFETRKMDTICYNPILNEIHVELGLKNIDVESYVNLFVATHLYPEHREEFLANMSIDYARKQLEDKDTFEYTFLLPLQGVPNYINIKVVKSAGHKNKAIIGFANVDKKIRDEQTANRLIKDSIEQATKANETKDTFLANISHELKTPLNAIVAYASLIRLDEEGKEKAQAYAKDILKETDIMLETIENLFDMSMIRNGEMILDDYLSNLTYVVETAVRNLSDKAKDKKVTVNKTINVEHNDVFCDGAKVGEICQKILDNAIVYSKPNQDVYISLVEIRQINDTALYEIQVIDEGIGIDENYLKSIFEPFSREASTTDAGIFGTGLGMAITKYYIEMMNGTIEIQSKKNVGTKVIIKLSFKLK